MQHYVSIDKEDSFGRQPIGKNKIKGSKYYLVNYHTIEISYNYEMTIPKGSVLVGRNYKPRWWRNHPHGINKVHRTKHIRIKQCGQALLVCLSYLELLQRKILPLNDVKITAYGEFMVKHEVDGITDLKQLNESLSKNEALRMTDVYGGTEANVLIALEQLGIDTRYASCFPQYNVNNVGKAIMELENHSNEPLLNEAKEAIDDDVNKRKEAVDKLKEAFDYKDFEKHLNDTRSITKAINILKNKDNFAYDRALALLKDNEYTHEAIAKLNELGVDTSYVDIQGNLFGEYYYLNDCTSTNRSDKTKFVREGSAINTWDISDFNFDDFFRKIEIFHLSGISLSLDDNMVAFNNALAFVKEAQKRKIKVSFDFNYRENMWKEKAKKNGFEASKALELAKERFKMVLPYVNIMLCSNKDIESFLDLDEATIECLTDDTKKGTITKLKEFKEGFFKKYSNCEYLVIRNRNKYDNYHDVYSMIITPNDSSKVQYRKFDVKYDVGGGDAFNAGILFGIQAKNKNLNYVLSFALECFVEKHSQEGDYLTNISAESIDEVVQKQAISSNPKILICVDKIDSEFENMKKALSKYARVDLKEQKYPVNNELANYDIFIGKRLKPEDIAEANNLKAVFAYKTGVDDFPLKELNNKNIDLYNSHIAAAPIAQYAFGLAISLVNRITECDKNMRNNVWYPTDYPYWKSLFNMKVGLHGFGEIGKEINKILRANGIDTFTIKRHEEKEYNDVNLVDSFDSLVEKTDLIICSLPYTDDTNEFYNLKRFKKMSGKYFVNVGRGNVVNALDLKYALENRILAGAAIDTWNSKPEKDESGAHPDSIFHGLNNIVLSPHQVSKVPDGHKNYVEDTTKNVLDYISYKELKNKVDTTKGY